MFQLKHHLIIYLIILIHFIFKVYAPMLFNIKTKSLWFYGAKLLFYTIQLSRYLPDNLKSVTDSVILRNGFFGHFENILIAMLVDKREHIKKLAFRKILKIRQTSSGHAEIRVFKVSTIKYLDADADWKSITEHSQTKLVNI